MSNADSSDDRAKKPPAASSPGTGKKSKSKGFIESSDFKPGWLETGPLPPDVLPSLPDPAKETSLADELAALQETLQRLYGSDTPDAATEEPAPAEDNAPAPAAQPRPEAPVAREAGPLFTDPLMAAEPSIIVPPSPTEPSAPEAVAPEAGGPEAVAPEAGVPEAVAPEAGVPEAGVPEAVAPEAGAPEGIAPEAGGPFPEPAVPAWLHQLLAEETVSPVEEAPPAPPLTEELPRLQWAEPEAAPEELLPAVLFHSELADEDLLEEGVSAGSAELAEPAVAPASRKAKRARAPRPQRPPRAPHTPRVPRPARQSLRRPSRLSTAMLATSLILLAVAAVVYFVNPFVRLALETASLARPVSTPDVAALNAADSGNWCVRGDFADDAQPRLLDDGSQGDVLANDAVFSLEYTIAQPGHYLWQVVDCSDTTRAFPASMAWITTEQPNQPVTFLFDSNERADRLFFPIPYAVTALDSATDFHIIGSFQDWIVDDASGRLEPLGGGGIYQQVRRIARSGNYQSYVIAGDPKRAIDAYGRTTEPIPFAFDTDHNGDYVVFLVDIDRGRASVMYDMPPLMTKLAFGGGHLRLSEALAGLAALLLVALLLRELTLRNRRLWMETGCPRCHEQELMRISRRPKERLLHLLAIPAYRYRCRNCTWEGTRLSEAGRSISPGATIAHIEGLR